MRSQLSIPKTIHSFQLQPSELEFIQDWVERVNQSVIDSKTLLNWADDLLLAPSDQAIDAIFHTLSFNPYPWPWVASDLRQIMNDLTLNPHGQSLFLGLVALYIPEENSRDPLMVPPSLIERLQEHGMSCSAYLLPVPLLQTSGYCFKTQLISMLLLDPSLQANLLPPSSFCIPSTRLMLLGLPMLYDGERFGHWDDFDDVQRGLFLESISALLAEQWGGQERALDAKGMLQMQKQTPQSFGSFLAFAPFQKAMDCVPFLTTSTQFMTMAHEISQRFCISIPQMAVSVTFHLTDQPFLRVALRSHEEGFILGHLDWPALLPTSLKPHEMTDEDRLFSLDQTFDRLLESLTALGIEYCYAIEPVMNDDHLCHHCQQPLISSPDHSVWRQYAQDMGIPPDGSHIHDE